MKTVVITDKFVFGLTTKCSNPIIYFAFFDECKYNLI